MVTKDGWDLPQYENGKQIVVPSPATAGWKTWFSGAGDAKNPTVRGGGTRIRLSWTAIEARGAKTVEWSYAEPVELHDGELAYALPVEWGMDDIADFLVILPSTVTTVNGGNTGNCNLVASGQGYNIIVPAPGTGARDVVLANAVPVPATGTGYWSADHDTGVITPTAGGANFHLLDVEVKIGLLKNIPFGNPLGVFDVETYKVEWCHQNWKLRLTVDKQSVGAGEVGGWLMLFRKDASV